MRKNVWLATGLALVAAVLFLGSGAAQQVQPPPKESGEAKQVQPKLPGKPVEAKPGGGIQLPQPPGGEKPPVPPGGDAKKVVVPPGPNGKAGKESTFDAKTETFTYSKAGDEGLQIVVHYPKDWKAEDKRSAIVFFADGDFSKKVDLDEFKYHANYLASRGMVAARAQYRTKQDDATIPDAVEDGRNAIHWVRENAGKLGVNPKKVAAGGGSAGALLLLGGITMDGKGADSEASKPTALIMFNVVPDMSPFADRIGGDKVAERLSLSHHLRKLPATLVHWCSCTAHRAMRP
jgi:hypothetical protein